MNSKKLISVSELCRKMRASRRPVKYRTIREWWVQGLLPVPARRWSQRASETYWRDDQIFARAKATYDFLKVKGASYDFVLLQLWASGYQAPPHRVRRAALGFLSSLKFYPKDGDGQDAVERLGDRMRDFAGQLVERFFADTVEVIQDRLKLGDALALGSSILFYPNGAVDEDATDLAAVLLRGLKDIRGAERKEDWVEKAAQMRKQIMEDVGLDVALLFLRTWINFVSQARAISEAPDLVFVRAHRTIIVVANFLRNICRRQQVNLGNMPIRMKAVAIGYIPYVMGTYIKLIDTEAYFGFRTMLIEGCAKVRAMDLA